MARHNRQGRGTDQRGSDYEISFQPDWLQQIKVTRVLESGRQSTKTLFRNAGSRKQAPGSRVRTRVSCHQHAIDFEIGIDDPDGVVRRIIVETVVRGRTRGSGDEPIVFTLDDQMPPPPPPGGGGGG